LSEPLQHPQWQRLDRQTIHNSPHLRVHLDTVQLPNGDTIDDYSVVEFNDVVMCVATDAAGDVIMLREYRYAVDQTMWTLPAGTIRRGAEEPRLAALRELQEETSYTAHDIKLVAELHDFPTKATHIVYVFRIRGAAPTAATAHEATEQIEVNNVSPHEVKQLIKTGQIKTASNIGALVLALPELFDL
jgi:ADP-ribose diphosphatase